MGARSRRFSLVELGEDVIPDETTILRFRHLLEKHRLSERIPCLEAAFHFGPDGPRASRYVAFLLEKPPTH